VMEASARSVWERDRPDYAPHLFARHLRAILRRAHHDRRVRAIHLDELSGTFAMKVSLLAEEENQHQEPPALR